MLSSTSLSDRPGLYPGTGYFIGPRVPHGLAAVVEGLTREVLRHRPEDIYVFAAHHFEKLLNLREQYHAEEYRASEFDDEFSHEFNLWPTKESKVTEDSSTSGRSPDKEVEVLESHKEASTDTEPSPDGVSTNSEKRRTSKHTNSRSPSNTRKSLRRSTRDKETSEPRAMRIISQMSAFHDQSKSILTKDIKQELRRNKLNSNEKGKTTELPEKGIRGERRSRTRVVKSDKNAEEIERLASTTSGKSSTRRTLKKVRRIETESETETEREIAAKAGLENGYHKSRVKGDNASREAIDARAGSKERRSEETARFSEHSSSRKVSSRALSMDRIRAYVLRKFASTASLEVLRSPTYVEQVQEVIDRAAPIIKEKLEEIRGPRGKRSRSVDLAWNEESFRQYTRSGKRSDEEIECKQEEAVSEKKKNGNGFVQANNAKQEEKNDSISSAESKHNKKTGRRRAVSEKNLRRRESGGHGDLTTVDRVDDDSEHGNKSEHETGVTRDTLEARLTATQSILEGISKSASELGARTIESTGDHEQEPSETEASDHANVISLPIVRPPSSRNCKSTTKNDTGSLILPPISPEAPKSTKKKDELSLPILSTTNGNHTKISQEQDDSKDIEEASTLRDVTSDMEDTAALPEDDLVIENTKEDLTSDCQSPMSDTRPVDEVKNEDKDEILEEDTSLDLAKKQDADDNSLNQDVEEEGPTETKEGRKEEIFKDSLNVTPEVVDVPPRPDSLEPQENEQGRLHNYNADSTAQGNAFDGLKDRLIEIEMAERSIEKALVGQRERDSEMKSKVGKSVDEGKSMSEIEEASNEETTSNEKEGSANQIEGSINEADSAKCNVEKSINNGKNMNNKTETLTDKSMKNTIEEPTNDTKNLPDEMESMSETGRSASETEVSKNEEKVDASTEATKEASIKDKTSTDKTKSVSIVEELPLAVEELAVKRHVNSLQSVNLRKNENAETSEAGNNDDATESKTVTTRESSESAESGNEAAESENAESHRSDENNSNSAKKRKKREVDELSATTPLSLQIPFSYVLSEGSPCEIPDSVTTVIIPDRPCPSPVTSDNEDHQLDLTGPPGKEESVVRCDIIEDISSKKDETRGDENRNEYGMEAFGEYIHPEAPVLPVDIDFVRGVKGAKSSQDIIIIHQDLDRIKEEGEEEEEGKENDVQGEEDKYSEEKDTEGEDKETQKLATLEDIMEHEENEEVNSRTIHEPESVEEISHIPTCEASPDTTNADSTSKDRTQTGAEFRSTLENSSEDSGSSQDTHTITSSDVKESTVSNRSVESPSVGRPIVPELNLDSLQDNTVSSFKMTANGTVTKESNGSAKESDTTMSLIELLTPDERLTIESHLVLPDRAEPDSVEEFTESSSRNLQSDVPEAEQLYRAEHVEYSWLEKDPLSTEAILEEEMKAQEEDITGLQTIPEGATYADLILEKKEEEEELCSEEEIARELINSLDKEMQLCVKELSPREEVNNSGESVEKNLEADDKSNQLLSESVNIEVIEEAKEGDREIILEKVQTLDNEKIAETEAIIKLPSLDVMEVKQKHEDENHAVTDEENKELTVNVEEKETAAETHQVAPLAQFEEDEFLQQNGRCEKADEKITTESECVTVDTGNIENQEKSCEKKEKDKEEKSYSEETCERKNSTVLEECQQGKLNDQEVISEPEKSETSEECKQANLEKRKEDEQDNLKLLEEAHKFSAHDELVISDDKIDNETKNEEEVNILLTENLLTKSESVPEPITSAILEQSEDHSDPRYWTKETRSSTMETVIAALDSNNACAGEETKAIDDASEIVEDELITREKEDFYSAVVKIQACIRGFLTRRRARKVPKTATVDHLIVPEIRRGLRESKSGRRLRREEALRKTTLSLENAFATGRLQHTGEFHDSVPLPLFDTSDSETNSSTFNESLDKEEAEAKLDNANSDTHERTDSHCQGHNCHRGFQKGNVFADHSTLPIVMHLLTDVSRNHFSQSSDGDLNSNFAGAKFMEPMVDILMLGYPRDDATLQNKYLNFITSVEDAGSNMDSLPLNDVVKIMKDSEDIQSSIASGEVSLREPLALPGTSQGVVIEELTSLDENVPSARSESIKPSTPLKTSLDTNSSVIPEESVLEDEETDDLGSSSKTSSADKDVVNGDSKHMKEEIEKRSEETSVETNCSKLENVEDVDPRDGNASLRSSEISHGSNGQADEEKSEKI